MRSNYVKELKGTWKFYKGDIEDAFTPDYDDSSWGTIVIPHTWNDIDTFTEEVRWSYRGPAWYRCHFDFEEKDKIQMENKVIFIDFQGIFGAASIWMNGRYKGRFTDGYTGYVVDISKEIKFGENILAIKVDNSYAPDVLPAREVPDYNLYGGIYREVYLQVLNKPYIVHNGVCVNLADLFSDKAVLDIEVEVQEGERCEFSIEAALYNKDYKKVGATTEFVLNEKGAFSSKLVVPNPNLWSVENPYVYKLVVTIYGRDGGKIDAVEEKIGIRTLEFDPNRGLFLNGKLIKLKGVNRHQCYPGLGNAVPMVLQKEDARIIKEMNANFVRASHYPQHPAFLEACDELGILVFEEIATWQTPGRYCPCPLPLTVSEEIARWQTIGEEFSRAAKSMMRAMIKRDRNHPCIIAWGMMNEARSLPLFEELKAVAKEMDPSRPTIYAENRLDKGNDLKTVSVPDVLGINYQLELIEQQHRLIPEKPLLITEHTNAEAERGNVEGMASQALRIAEEIDFIERQDYLVGSALWCMHDYGTEYDPSWPVQKSGVLDVYRLPKYAYHYLRIHWSSEPDIFIAGSWTWPGQEGEKKKVLIFTNCDRVELWLNDMFLGEKRLEDAKIKNVLEWEIVYQPGVLKAIGIKEGRKVVSGLVTTNKPEIIKVDAIPSVVEANGKDIVLLTVRILDREGKLVDWYEGELPIKLSHNRGQICGVGGKNILQIKGGVGRVVFKAGIEVGEEEIIVEGEGLYNGKARIYLVNSL